MRDPRTSIVRRLVLVTLVAGLLAGILGALVVQLVERRSLVDEAQARNAASATRTAALVDSRVHGLGSELALVADREAVLPGDERATDELATALGAADDFDRLVLYDLQGRPFAASSTSEVVEVADLAPLDTSRLTGRDAELVTAGENSAIRVTIDVEDPPGTTVGWLVGSTPLTLLTAELTADTSRSGVASGIVTTEGTIVAHREFDRVVGGRVLPVGLLFPGEQRTATTTELGEPTLLAGARLRSMPGWVVTEQPRPAAVAPIVDRAAARTFVLVVVLATVVGVVIAAGRRWLRPLRQLADAVERVGAGEHGVQVDVVGKGEVGILADGIERMARSLEQREDELREAEAAARRSEERLRLMVEGVEDYAIVLLAPDATIRTWNAGARRLLGYSPQESLGRPLADMFDPDDPPPDPVADIADTGRIEVEGWCRRADGSRFWAAVAAAHLRDDTGAPYGIAVILHDLTERRAAREATEVALEREQQAAQELRRANELKDEFLAIAAHEMRTPLSVILAGSRLLATDPDAAEDDEMRRVRTMVQDHADDLRQIVDRLLEFTRLQAGKVRLEPEPTDLRREIDAHLRSLGPALRDHEVRLDVDADELRVDRSALGHIVGNLVSNAAKFSPTGSVVSVSARRDGTELILTVTDEGFGVAPDDHDRIFELFRQGTREVVTVRGTGVGLAIVKRYVELLGGRISVASTPGVGSVFTVRLPVDG